MIHQGRKVHQTVVNTAAGVAPPLSLIDEGKERKQKDKTRVLFVSVGWPTGEIEVASWLKQHVDSVDVSVFQMRPPLLFTLIPEAESILTPGRINPELVGTFIKWGLDIQTSDTVRKRGRNSWEILSSHHPTYVIRKKKNELFCFDESGLALDDAKTALVKIAKDRGFGKSTFLGKGGGLNQLAMDITESVGGGFLKKLADFNPHVAGFRLQSVWNFSIFRYYFDVVRHLSDALIAAGGPEATMYRKGIFEALKPDYLFSGDAEQSFERFIRMLGPRDSRSEMKPGELSQLMEYGVSSSAGISMVTPMLSEKLLDSYAIDWSLMEGFRREDGSPAFYLSYSTSRGCPHPCTLCSHSQGRVFRKKSPRRMMSDLYGLDDALEKGLINVRIFTPYSNVDDPAFRSRKVGFIHLDEDNFMFHRGRVLGFFRLWEKSELSSRYRIGMQTTIRSLIRNGVMDEELMAYIDRLKPFLQFGAESENPRFLKRLKKPHTVKDSAMVFDRMEKLGMNYVASYQLSDYDTTPEECVENLRLTALNHIRRRHMELSLSYAINPQMGSETQRMLEKQGRLTPDRIKDHRDYETTHPELMNPLVVELLEAARPQLEYFRQRNVGQELRRVRYWNAFDAMESVIKAKLGQKTPVDESGNTMDKRTLRALGKQIIEARREIELAEI